MVYPFFSTVYLSLTNWNGVAEAKDFVGFSNYAKMFGDGDVLKAFANNVIWVVLGTVVPVVIGLVLSILIWSGVRGSLFFRTIFFSRSSCRWWSLASCGSGSTILCTGS